MELRPLVLAILESRPLCGYEIVQRAPRRANRNWEEGTLYPLLHRLVRDGLLSGAVLCSAVRAARRFPGSACWKGPGGADGYFFRRERSTKSASFLSASIGESLL